MWPGLQNGVDTTRFGTMKPEQVLYEFDGPRIFTFRDSTAALCLAYLSEELDDGSERFIVAPTSHDYISELRAGRLSVREALTSQWMWVVDRDRAGKLSSAWAVVVGELHPDALPEPSVALYAEQHSGSIELADLPASANIRLHVDHLGVDKGLLMEPLLDAVKGIFHLVLRFFERMLPENKPALKYSSAASGSLRISASLSVEHGVDDSTLAAIAQKFRQESLNVTHSESVDEWKVLLLLLDRCRVTAKLDFLLDDQPFTVDLDSNFLRHMRSQLRKSTGRSAPKKLLSEVIPQANDLQKVIKAVRFMNEKFSIDPSDLGVSTPRQVLYYRHAARLLSLMDENSALTNAGKHLLKLTPEAQLSALCLHFETSDVGRSWLDWKSADSILELSPDSAQSFLASSAIGLSAETLRRRASTLETWLQTLKPHHYARE